MFLLLNYINFLLHQITLLSHFLLYYVENMINSFIKIIEYETSLRVIKKIPNYRAILARSRIPDTRIRRVYRFFWRILSKTTSCYKQETSSRHWIPGQYERPPHQPQLNSTVSHLYSLRTRDAPSVKSLCIIGRAEFASRRLFCRLGIIKGILVTAQGFSFPS